MSPRSAGEQVMRLWRETQRARSSPLDASVVISVLAHAVLIGIAVQATERRADLVSRDALSNRPYYVPPPRPAPVEQGVMEHLTFVALPGGVGGTGVGGIPGFDSAAEGRRRGQRGSTGPDTVASFDLKILHGPDSVLTEVDVDSAVTRDPSSVGPAYPPALLQQGVQGSVAAQYVVDTTGFADPATLQILRSSNPQFTEAVRAALPLMRFTPAKLNNRKVRQLVQQEFSFRILNPRKTAPAAAKKEPGAEAPVEEAPLV